MTTFKGALKTINGDKVIGMTTSKMARINGWMDRASMASWYREDPNNRYFGMVDLFTNYADVKVPFLKGMFDKKAVIMTNGFDNGFEYDLPVYKRTCTKTMKDMSTQAEKIGIDEAYFQIALSDQYQPGDKLTYSLKRGEQIIVSEDHPVIPEGDYFIHTVQMTGGDPEKWYPADKLKANVEYFKVGHSLAEFSTQYSNIEMKGQYDTIRCEFILGNHRGVSTAYTAYADSKSFSGANTQTKNMWNKMQSEMEQYTNEAGEQLDMFFMGNKDKMTGKLKGSTMRFGSLLEYLTILENVKMEAHELLFQRGGVIKTSSGVKRLNEGAYHQWRRGRRFEYSREGGITKNLLRNVVDYIFQNRPDLMPHQRRVHFKCGYGAFNNMVELFREEFKAQLTGLSFVMGNDRSIPNPVGGDLNGLILKPVLIKEVAIPEIGIVSIEPDPSLNYEGGSDRFSRGFNGHGYADEAYSMVIYDAASSEYSNARQDLPSGTTLIDNGDKKANLYYVKPEGDHMWWGYEQGRWSPTQTSEIVSSSKTMSREFWVHSTSGAWVKDVSRYVVIELKRK